MKNAIETENGKCFIFSHSILRNENDADYGNKYTIFCPADDFISAKNSLIINVIGEDFYYSQRDVWNQIIIQRR